MIELDIFLNGEAVPSLDAVISGKVFHIVAESEGKINEIVTSHLFSTDTFLQMAQNATAPMLLVQVKPCRLRVNIEKLKTMIFQFEESDALLAYSDYTEYRNEEHVSHPVTDYLLGSIRDDFDLGPAVLIKTSALRSFLESNPTQFQQAGWYNLRLFLTRIALPLHFCEMVFGFEQHDLRASGQKQFDYVDPRNRERQIEMEQAATIHLEELGMLVSPPFKSVDFEEFPFDIEASVIIPVLNRERTIADAVQSVLMQKTSFPFNLIVINNHSTDQTGAIIDAFNDSRIVNHTPSRTDLGIGGCWNEGVNHPLCGRFAVQLDSDDLYKDATTLQKIVDKFREEHCAMVIGSYQMVNFDLEEIPPGIIDHREWTDHNGPNNALRINGLGAPRAFYTPVIRQIGFPNVSYGEDYAVGLAISREYKVGRIYEPVYLCRRWENNTDSNLSIEKMNAHNVYKDSLRTREIEERKKSVVSSHQAG